MKTTFLKSLLCIGCLVTMAGVIEAKAEEPVKRIRYSDEDKDGVSDNWNGQCKRDWYHYVDENNDGICDNRTLQFSGSRYQDLNEDGICDHNGSGRQRHGRK